MSDCQRVRSYSNARRAHIDGLSRDRFVKVAREFCRDKFLGALLSVPHVELNVRSLIFLAIHQRTARTVRARVPEPALRVRLEISRLEHAEI